MKLNIVAFIALFFLFVNTGWAEEPAVTLQLDHKNKTVELVPGGKESFAYVRVRLPRKNDRPLEIRLSAVEPSQSPMRYRGTFHEWEGNMAGVEVEISLDRKNWRKLKNVLKRAF